MSSLLLIVRRSLRQHALSSVITILSVALATGLVMAVFGLQKQTRDAFTGDTSGFDAVLGARGSALQLVLNAVFHLETSPGNLPWKTYQAVKEDPAVELAIPYALGDNYHGFRLVGTTEELFTKFEYTAGRKFQLAEGQYFDVLRREAVLGSFAAQRTKLRVGDVFSPYHGLSGSNDQHSEEYVVGILQPTNTPNDRVIWIPIEGVFRMGGHILRGAGKEYQAEAGKPIPDEEKEVSAVMLKFSAPQAGFNMAQRINRQGKVATLAFPIGTVVAELFDKLGWMSQVLLLVAYLVIVVASGSILASIYNSMNERRREFAILRALGARRGIVFSAIILESGTIAVLGSLVGFAVYAGIMVVAAEVIRAQTGVVVDLLQFHPAFISTPLAMTALGALAGLLPAYEAYRTDVASTLVPTT